VVGGAALVALAARDRSWRSISLALAGAPLVWRGATGSWPTVPRAVADRLPDPLPPSIEVSLTVNRPRQEVYAFWRRLENLPRFMRHIDSVTETGDGRSHWVGKSPVGANLGAKIEWDAEIVEDREGQVLSWQSLPGSQVDNAGSVVFADATGGRGTVVRVHLDLDPPGGGVGRAISRMLSPITKQQVHEDLRRFKNLLEAGEVPTTDGQPAGQRSKINSLINPHNPF
jgi:uncharacterized membrane protein